MKRILGIAFLALSLSACGWLGFGKKDDSSSGSSTESSGTEGGGTSGYGETTPEGPREIGGDPNSMDPGPLPPPDAQVPQIGGGEPPPPADRVVYFAYDSAEMDEAGQKVIGQFADYLNARASAKVRLEGHTDARGSREYNIGLGERRAETVRNALLARGVKAAQIALLSYGEERPVDPSTSEAAYARNRRVEFIK